jgi:polar amino acid transport system substrate-binding protein
MRRRLTTTTLVLATVLTASGLPASGATETQRKPVTPSFWAQRVLPPLPAEVRNRGRWVIGVKCDFPPFGYVNPRGEKAGFDVDIARRFAELAFGNRSRIDFVCVTTPSRIPTLLARTVDIVLATFTWTKQRAEVIDFSLPYYAAGGRLAVLRGSAMKSVKDLPGKSVVTTRGSVYDRWMPTCLKAAQPLAVDSPLAALAALKEGRAHAFMYDEAFLLNFIATEPAIQLTQDSFLQIPWGIGVRKGESVMLQWVNAAIQLMTRKDEFFPLLRRNIPPVAVGDVPRPGRPALNYPIDVDPLTNCMTITLPPRETASTRPHRRNRPNFRGTASGSVHPLRQCPVCGFQATFVFSELPAKGSTLTAVWYYNRQKQGEVAKHRAKTVKSFIKWAGPAPRGFHWCDLVVKPPGKRAGTVARAVIRRR